ncbi:hypothetical protein [Clostridium tertium]|uniref:DUF3784 domain-containing protein n=1 Tax=Clostridium tertium TaxID=1559 RepID=A0A6N3G654_9CLOT
MKITSVVLILGSLGFILMGLVSLLSKKMKDYFKESGVYNNSKKFLEYNGIFNLIIGITGVIFGILDYLLLDKSRILIILYIIVIVITSTIQKKVLKKYRNF